MAEGLSGHPILSYLTFVLPAVLLVAGLAARVNIFLIIMTLLWLAVAFAVLYLPLAGDNGSKS